MYYYPRQESLPGNGLCTIAPEVSPVIGGLYLGSERANGFNRIFGLSSKDHGFSGQRLRAHCSFCKSRQRQLELIWMTLGGRAQRKGNSRSKRGRSVLGFPHVCSASRAAQFLNGATEKGALMAWRKRCVSAVLTTIAASTGGRRPTFGAGCQAWGAAEGWRRAECAGLRWSGERWRTSSVQRQWRV